MKQIKIFDNETDANKFLKFLGGEEISSEDGAEYLSLSDIQYNNDKIIIIVDFSTLNSKLGLKELNDYFKKVK